MSIRRIPDPLQHHHPILLSIVIKVLREIPRRGQHLLLDHPSNQLLPHLSLLRAELIRSIRYLIGIRNLLYPNLLEHLLSVPRGLVLAYVLGGNERLELLVLVVVGQRAELIPVDLHANLLDDLLEDLVVDVEELVQFEETDPVLVLLQETNHVGLRPLLDEVLVLPTLGVVDLDVRLRLYLTH